MYAMLSSSHLPSASLTSKSEMRFQGRLSALNSEEATITLENGKSDLTHPPLSPLYQYRLHPLFIPTVRACGTEGRKAALGVPHEEMGPNPDVYEVIVFRAADVKDLRIDDPTPLPSAAAGANERVKEAAQTQVSSSFVLARGSRARKGGRGRQAAAERKRVARWLVVMVSGVACKQLVLRSCRLALQWRSAA